MEEFIYLNAYARILAEAKEELHYIAGELLGQNRLMFCDGKALQFCDRAKTLFKGNSIWDGINCGKSSDDFCKFGVSQITEEELCNKFNICALYPCIDGIHKNCTQLSLELLTVFFYGALAMYMFNVGEFINDVQGFNVSCVLF